MKTIFKFLLLLISALLITACATAGNVHVPEKYSLGGQLEEVQWIWKTRIIDWEDVDNQSLIIQTSPGEYYLIVLKIPSMEIPFRTNRIGITHSQSRIRAGLDNIIVYNESRMRNSYPIDKIYRLEGMKQMRDIRDQLTGKKDAQKNNTIKQKLPDKKSTAI